MLRRKLFIIGGLIIRIGFYTTIISMIRSPQNSIGHYLGPYIMCHLVAYKVFGHGLFSHSRA